MPRDMYDSLAEYNDMAKMVIAAMLTLPDEQWLVLFHRFYNSLSFAEIARVLDMSRDKVQRLEAVALRNLRRREVSETLKQYDQ